MTTTMHEIPTSVTDPLILFGNCLDLLESLPAASVDAYVSDPPAAIDFMGSKTRTWDRFNGYQPRTDRGREVMASLVDVLGLPRGDAGFVVFMCEHWLAVRRVLKPGAYIVAWALPKTSDLAGLAMRLAGLDMEMPVLHMFGASMPKGTNIAKDVEALMLTGGSSPKNVADARDISGQGIPADGQTHSFRVGESKQGVYRNKPGQAWEATTDAAKRWDGYNSQLAPGFEHWLVARNPTPLTYARNCMEHGCGAYHVDSCRIPRGEGDRKGGGKGGTSSQPWASTNTYGDGETATYVPGDGGYPKNVLLTVGGESCPAAELDRQSGVSPSNWRTSKGDGPAFVNVYGDMGGLGSSGGHADTGGASRFYTQLPIGDLDHRFTYKSKARDRGAGIRSDLRNEHNTLKTLALMRWLMRLVVPTAKATGGLPGVVLSTFMGSGTDGVAAISEGFRFVGMEMDPGHYEVACARVAAAIGDPVAAAEANKHTPVGGQLGLL